MRTLSSLLGLTVALLACLAFSTTAAAQDLRAYDRLGDSDTWTGITLITDMGFHSGRKPGSGRDAPNGLQYSDVDDRSLNLRMGMMSWPARAPFTEGSTVFGQPVGFALELWGGVYSLFGGGESEDFTLRGGLNVDILYPLIQAQSFAVVATFQGGITLEDTYGGVQFGPGVQGLYQLGSLRFILEYRFLPLWIGDNVVAHDARARVHFQLGDTFFLGLFGNLNITQLREIEAGYTRNTTALGLEMGF